MSNENQNTPEKVMERSFVNNIFKQDGVTYIFERNPIFLTKSEKLMVSDGVELDISRGSR